MKLINNYEKIYQILQHQEIQIYSKKDLRRHGNFSKKLPQNAII